MEAIASLYGNNAYADLHFSFPLYPSTPPFPAHTAIVYSRCPELLTPHPELYDLSVSPVSVVLSPPSAFLEILRFLYCGKISVSPTRALSMLYAARLLKINALPEIILSYTASSLCSTTAISYFDKALLYGEDQVREDALNYIRLNARECVEQDAFAQISEEALLYLVRDPHLALPEILLFRGVIKWAKHHGHYPLAHPDPFQAHPTLQEALQHIRYGAIDGEILLDEVRSAGVVPLRLMVRATTPRTPSPSERRDPFFVPRIPVPSKEPPSLNVLSKWLPATFPWNDAHLFYKASTHGFGTENFLQMCGDAQASLVVIYTTANDVFGGFFNLPWNTAHKKPAVKGCFMFVLRSLIVEQPLLLPQISRVNVLSLSKDGGPGFGGGDLILDKDMRSGEMNLGVTFSCVQDSIGGMYSYIGETSQFTVKEIEVYGWEEDRHCIVS